ncbi:MAG: FkbM family methyltransferase [Pseudomonadota bacterium]
MQRIITELIQAVDIPLPQIPRQILVYGAGNKGKQVIQELLARGVEIPTVLDTNATPERRCADIPVQAPAEWLGNHDASTMAIVIAIHNEHTPIPPILHQLREAGFARVLTPIDLHDLFPDLPFHYWLAPRRFYLPFASELERLDGMLADATSRTWLNAALQLRLGGDYDALPPPGLLDQYFPQDLPRWPQPLRLIDGGAYTGDTLRQLDAAGYTFGAIAAFEPDLDNFRTLAHNCDRYDSVICLPCGLAEQTKRIGFTAGMGGGSHIDSNAPQQITCVALDEALPNFRPNLIKLDVEGAELDALTGAARTIARHRPALAVSLYHHPEHLWRIPFLIESWKLGYRFYVRGHAQSSFDLVLYALPA